MSVTEAKEIVKGEWPDCSRQLIADAWQKLVDTGHVWSMGRHYSNLAASMIAAGTLERNAA